MQMILCCEQQMNTRDAAAQADRSASRRQRQTSPLPVTAKRLSLPMTTESRFVGKLYRCTSKMDVPPAPPPPPPPRVSQAKQICKHLLTSLKEQHHRRWHVSAVHNPLSPPCSPSTSLFRPSSSSSFILNPPPPPPHLASSLVTFLPSTTRPSTAPCFGPRACGCKRTHLIT